MSSSLLLTRRFAPLFWTQFFAAFSDNFLKQALIFLILFKIGGTDANVLVTLAPAVFIAPYFFLSAFGGEMADRYDKALVAQRIKLAEIGVSADRGVRLLAAHGRIRHRVVTFCFWRCSASASAVRCSARSNTAFCPTIWLAPNCPPATRWSKARPSLPSCSAPSSAALPRKDGGDPASFGFLMIIFSLLCWGASLFIPPTGEARARSRHPPQCRCLHGSLFNHLRDDQRIWWGAFVTSWFWLAGAVVATRSCSRW